MSDVNWWLMALAFVLGLLLTFAFMLRRVKREVPVYGALGRAPGVGDVGSAGGAAKVAGAEEATTRLPRADADEATTQLPKAGATGAAAAAGGAAAVAGGAAASKFTGTPEVKVKPYGEGSIRLATGTADAPEGYTVKGNEDSMLYHTPESPSYAQTIAEIWFKDVESAERAGFNRWDSGKSQRGKQ
ncbi:hypothetical protein [Mycobacterium hubeiense]|uniref:channel accessory protein ArfC, sunset domain variant n=1 Tax=Mycobacterium hubeiense TaxID=1867256 RepID=UPI000C7F696D|nr:hypothetical protein [Mycobacterium sp. QGD 101]